MPSTPADFTGLLASAVRDDNPVVFFQDVALLHQAGEVPEGEHVVPLGAAAERRAGPDVTLISYGKTVHTCLTAAGGGDRRGRPPPDRARKRRTPRGGLTGVLAAAADWRRSLGCSPRGSPGAPGQRPTWAIDVPSRNGASRPG